ncbi:MAG: hypothetical protein MUF69_07055 [Desulfobacterota bacterium]|nr:hypothetical protein [Thermodesulfobacteriota bacterium]
MKICVCLKRQEKSLRDPDYETCRHCPQTMRVKDGKETDRDIDRIIRDLSQSPFPPGFFRWTSLKSSKGRFMEGMKEKKKGRRRAPTHHE